MYGKSFLIEKSWNLKVKSSFQGYLMQAVLSYLSSVMLSLPEVFLFHV